MGKALGVDEKWVYNIIKQVGNYGESFDRNVGMGSPLKVDRGQNALWTKAACNTLRRFADDPGNVLARRSFCSETQLSGAGPWRASEVTRRQIPDGIASKAFPSRRR